ncbi:MAG: hypothetical protein A2Z17_07670 [Gammaproteobacteria bacterium RBG_16_66_13]|nr:MAG: hypothetical protein A2Z17_07670 [Gammaproteobacteria bacterium RBG_16_66_13]
MPSLTSDQTLLDLPVATLLRRRPEATRAFLDRQMACIGCQFSPFDTVAEALDIHQVSAEDFLAALHQAVPADGPQRTDPLSSQGETT